ncbi:hypothetical protein [Pimelobacter simplex]|uniref:hypothetical protein n=1 Tax=Nocardioides simplex TaxID=2045 RepID=UPI0019340078|nr:hypothetical protein [Pimelobacter simplex]
MAPSGSPRLSQSRHTTDGLLVERLPIGNATESGDTFVMVVFSSAAGQTFRFPEGGASPWRSIGVEAPSRTAHFIAAGGAASSRSAQWIAQLRLIEPCELEIVYGRNAGTMVRESVFVDPTATDGQHRLKLPDGSVVERLPIGIAAGDCWLRFVRTRIPDGEVQRYDAYEEALDAALEAGDDQPDDPWPEPVERFLQLRSGGRTLPSGGRGYTEGGREQRFEVAVRADELASDLEISYLFDGGVVVATERIEVSATGR